MKRLPGIIAPALRAESLAGLECRSCGGRTGVINSRRSENLYAIRRTRKCGGCGRRFTTIEMPSSDVDELNRRMFSLQQSLERATEAIAAIRSIIWREKERE